MFDQKINKIQTSLKKNNTDGLLIGNFGHQIHDDLLYYLLLKHLELGLLYIPPEGPAVLYAISFEVPELQDLFPSLQVHPFQDARMHIEIHAKESPTLAIRPSALPETYARLIRSLPNISVVDFVDDQKIMAVKLPEELTLLKKAAELTDTIFLSLLGSWTNFSTETEAAQFIISETIRLGCEPSFPPIVASGPNAALPHHHPMNTKLTKGFCVIDMGVRCQGYCSDMTRTIFLGEPTLAEIQLYKTLLESQELGIQTVRAGASTQDIDSVCRTKLGPDLNKEFIHFLGHGLGTQVHEWPRVGSKENVVLEENMLITIEPGVYRAQSYGMRIEDDVVVGNTNAIVLTKSSKDLLSFPLPK